jgi:hypothetical protein
MNQTPELKTEVQDLTWELIDELATDAEVRRLGELLDASPEARQVYIRCTQMHADLSFLLGNKRPRFVPKRGRRTGAALYGAGQPAALPAVAADGPLPSATSQRV